MKLNLQINKKKTLIQHYIIYSEEEVFWQSDNTTVQIHKLEGIIYIFKSACMHASNYQLAVLLTRVIKSHVWHWNGEHFASRHICLFPTLPLCCSHFISDYILQEFLEYGSTWISKQGFWSLIITITMKLFTAVSEQFEFYPTNFCSSKFPLYMIWKHMSEN